MPAKSINGKTLAKKVIAKLQPDVTLLESKGVKPSLAVILVGSDPASMLYVEKKEAACKQLGIESKKMVLDEKVSEGKLLRIIERLNSDSRVHGILVQLPLPKHIDTLKVMEAIAPEKDVDGFSSANYGKLFLGEEELASCTAKGIVMLIESTGKKIQGANCCIVGSSNVVGKPLALMLLNRNATVTVCNKHTKKLADHTLKADILVVAVGKPGLINKDMVKKGAVVIDVGISREGKNIVGDVVADVKKVAGFVTPVPGGVGPMTVACLMQNTLAAAKKQAL